MPTCEKACPPREYSQENYEKQAREDIVSTCEEACPYRVHTGKKTMKNKPKSHLRSKF